MCGVKKTCKKTTRTAVKKSPVKRVKKTTRKQCRK